MSRIITITLNPALDKSIMIQSLEPERKLKAENVKTEPGGGGINVSRALHKLGMEAGAVYLAGGYTGNELTRLLEKEGVNATPVEIKNDSRENFIVLDQATTKQYRFGMEGPNVDEQEWRSLLEKIRLEKEADYIVASGSASPGIPTDFYKELAAVAHQLKARLVVDTSGPALDAALKEGVFLVKPNIGELAALASRDKNLTIDGAVAAATHLIKSGACEMMVVSMGGDGALLVTAKGHHLCKPPKVKVLSTVGAGDSMLAGLLYALVNGYSEKELLAYGIAAGTAATLHPGTELCSKVDTERLYQEITASS